MKKSLSITLLTLLLFIVLAGCAAGGTGGQSTGGQSTGGQSPATQAPAASPAATEAASTVTAPSAEVPATGAEATGAAPAATQPAEAQPEAPAAEGSALRFELTPEQSEARYRVREQLVNLNLPNDAIGATRQVSGTVVINPDGSIDAATSRFEVDLSTLKSDSDRRDNFVRSNVLQTDQFPTAVFVPTRVEGLTFPIPDSGQFTFRLIGDLTIRDVTKEVAWDVTGTLENGQAQGQARTEFNFATFNLTQPRVPVVLSIEDRIILELDGVFSRVGDTTSAPAESVAQTNPTAAPDPAAVAVATVPACSAPAELTPPMTEGPYYKPGAPERTSLLEPDMTGTKLLLTGYVLSPDCQPISNAVVDFWQTDAQGNYDNAGYRMRGQQHTDANGMYRLETVIPGEYPGRTQHIHVKVQAPNGPVVTSQLFFPESGQNQSDRIFDQRLLVNIQAPGDSVQGTFNFVVPVQ